MSFGFGFALVSCSFGWSCPLHVARDDGREPRLASSFAPPSLLLFWRQVTTTARNPLLRALNTYI